MTGRSRILLIVSLALNLFLVGAIVGGLVVGQRLRAQRPPPMGPALWAAARDLPKEQRAAYREILRGETRRQLRAAREARAEAWSGLTEEPLDADAVRRRLAVARALDSQARGALEDRIVAFAETLSPEDRARFAEGLTRQRRDRPPRGAR
jgi:uncharacterized membrane protein